MTESRGADTFNVSVATLNPFSVYQSKTKPKPKNPKLNKNPKDKG